MFKFYIKKCYIRRTCSSETKQNFKRSFSPLFKDFDVLWTVPNQGSHDPHLFTLSNRLQWTHAIVGNLETIPKKIFFPKLEKSEEILEIRKKN